MHEGHYFDLGPDVTWKSALPTDFYYNNDIVVPTLSSHSYIKESKSKCLLCGRLQAGRVEIISQPDMELNRVLYGLYSK